LRQWLAGLARRHSDGRYRESESPSRHQKRASAHYQARESRGSRRSRLKDVLDHCNERGNIRGRFGKAVLMTSGVVTNHTRLVPPDRPKTAAATTPSTFSAIPTIPDPVENSGGPVENSEGPGINSGGPVVQPRCRDLRTAGIPNGTSRLITD